MPIELFVNVKDAEGKKLTKPFLLYEPFTFCDTDPMINQCVKEVLEEFKGEPDDIKIRAVMVMR